MYATANLNPGWYTVGLAHGTEPIQGKTKSTWGYGFDYAFMWPRFGVNGTFERNSTSDAKLVVPPSQTYAWEIDRMDFGLLATGRMPVGKAKKWDIFGQAGPGMVLTNGYLVSGKSADFALIGGAGADYHLGSRWKFRVRETLLFTKQGCYGDPTCSERHSFETDLWAGFVTMFGKGTL